MKNYECTVEIGATPGAVFEALTTEKGLKGWWTTTCDVGAGVGSKSKFRFGQTYNVMQVERSERGRELIWRCLEQLHEDAALTQKDEWAGTRVKFRLESLSVERTTLHFVHEGLNARLECYGICERGWNHFLKTSLKRYVESGRGEPFSG